MRCVLFSCGSGNPTILFRLSQGNARHELLFKREGEVGTSAPSSRISSFVLHEQRNFFNKNSFFIFYTILNLWLLTVFSKSFCLSQLYFWGLLVIFKEKIKKGPAVFGRLMVSATPHWVSLFVEWILDCEDPHGTVGGRDPTLFLANGFRLPSGLRVSSGVAATFYEYTL